MKSNYEVFKYIAEDYGLEAVAPEKDYWMTYLIKRLSELSFPTGRLVFGGGTSLVKAHRVMKRFSEDIDFRFVSDVPLNRTKKSKIKHSIADYLSSLDEFTLIGEPGARSNNTLVFYKLNYPHDDRFGQSEVLRPFIKFEIFFTEIYYPSIRCPIISLHNEYKHLPPEAEFDCVAIEDTAIDKISSLLWRVGTDGYESADIRHLHDLAMLADKLTVDDKFRELLNMTYNRDMTFRGKSDMELKQSIDNALAIFSENKRYASDYNNYVLDVSYAPESERLSFREALDRFTRLVRKLVFG